MGTYISKKNIFLVIIAVFGMLYGIAQANTANVIQHKQLSYAFTPSDNLRDRVDFWKLIFTEYGENQLVFHHRDYPELIYSVLDISRYRSKLSERAFKHKKEKIIKQERARIKKAITALLRNSKPNTELQVRISQLFTKIPGKSAVKYRKALGKKQIRVQTGIKERFREGVKRSARYMAVMEETFRLAGLPVELARIPLIESSFDYNAYSSVGAAGIWQFMRSTGRSYMHVNSYIDERRDPIFATRAATLYLTDAYNELQSWPLAITSYNHGVNGMKRAIRKLGSRDMAKVIRHYKGRTFGFASKNFYVEFLAALEIEQNYKQYFPDLVLDAPIEFDEIQLGKAISFSQLVHYSGESTASIKAFNRSLRHSITANRIQVPKSFVVKVPRGKGNRILTAVPNSKQLSIPGARSTFIARLGKLHKSPWPGSRYKVRKGDTIASIARKFRVSQRSLMRENRVTNPKRLRIGQVVRIPGRGNYVAQTKKKSKRTPVYASRTKNSSGYKIRRGDTIGKIAKRYRVSERTLMAHNGIRNPRKLRVGQVIKIPSATSKSNHRNSSAKVLTASNYTHRVRRGDTVGAIARRHGVSQKSILVANNISNPKTLKVGQKLIIPTYSRTPAVRTKTYTVRPGDNLTTIAKRHNTTVPSIKRLNSGLTSVIYPGQRIRLVSAQ